MWHRKIAVIAAVTLCLVLGAGLCQAQESLIQNGDFAGPVSVSGERECPGNWDCSPALGIKRFKDSSGAYYLRLEAKTPPVGGAYVTQTIAYDAPEGKPADYALTCDVKYDDCIPGPQGYMRARVLVLYTTSDRVLHDGDSARYFKGTADWQRITIPCTFPPDTKQIQVLMGFHTSSGALSVRNIKLSRANLADLPKVLPGVVSREVGPGIIETDYGVTKTLQVAGQSWYELPDHDAASKWYRMPDTRGDYDPLFANNPAFTEAEKSRGFVVYQQPDTMVASTSGVPDRKHILDAGKPVRVSLCPGETRSAVVGVYPIKSLPACEVKFSTFTDAAGNKIAPENIRADVLESLYNRANEFQQYVKMPRVIRRFGATDLAAGEATQFWVYCTAPKGTPAGVYKGKARLLSAGDEFGAIDFQITVYPFELAQTPVHWSMYYYYLPDQDLDADLKQMQDWGMNSVIYCPPATSIFERLKVDGSGNPSFEFGPDDEFMTAYKKAGYTQPAIYYPRLLLLRLVSLLAKDNAFPQEDFYGAKIPLISTEAEYPPAALEAYKKVIRSIADHAKQAGWPEFIFYLTDEPFEGMWRVAESGLSYRLAKEVAPEIKTFCTVYSPVLAEKFGGTIDYISSRGLQSAAPRPENKTMREACAKTGSSLWASCWPPLYWHNYWFARAYSGFVAEKSGFEGMNVWFYPKIGKGYTDRFKTLQPRGSEGGLILTWSTDKGEFEHHTVLEGMREGILDARYIATLKNAIAKAEKAGRNVKAYRAELAKLVDSAPTLLADTGGMAWDRPGLFGAGKWSVEENERLRERIAAMIVELGKKGK